MALALLWLEDDDDGSPRLGFDIGRNRYCELLIGTRDTVDSNGIRRLADVRHRVEVAAPAEAARGRGSVTVPRDSLSRDERYAQLASYRDKGGAGPAVSEILEIPLDRIAVNRAPPAALTAGGRARGVAMNRMPPMYVYARATRAALPSLPVESVRFRWRERPPMSQALFLEALLGGLTSALPFLKDLAPIVGPALGGLLGGSAGTAVQNLITPDNLTKLFDLIKKAAGPAAVAPQPATHSLALALLHRRQRASAASRGYATSQGYSEAMIAPALLAALPALMPLLQQVLSPQTIQGILDVPQKATGQIINGLIDFAKIGMAGQEKEREHLRAIHPGVDDPALDQLMNGMSLGLAATARLRYRRVGSVALAFDGVEAQAVFGRTRVVYRHGAELQFPVSVTTPRPIRDARLLLQVKHPDTLEVLHESEMDAGAVTSGPLATVPRMSAQAAGKLAPNADCIVCVTLMWKNKKGERLGAPVQQTVMLIGEFSFDRVEETAEPVALSDFDLHRDYWHKIWQDEFTSDGRRAEINCRYYFVLNPKRTNNARSDSRVRLGEGGERLRGRLKAGMELSPFALNQLLKRLAPEAAALGDAELQALSGPDFVERFNQAAEKLCKLRGRAGEGGSIWVYPEFKVQTVVLVQAADAEPTGHVKRLAEARVRFPVPVIVHFIGVKRGEDAASADGEHGPLGLAGMNVVFDERVTLFPVELEEVKPSAVAREDRRGKQRRSARREPVEA